VKQPALFNRVSSSVVGLVFVQYNVKGTLLSTVDDVPLCGGKIGRVDKKFCAKFRDCCEFESHKKYKTKWTPDENAISPTNRYIFIMCKGSDEYVFTQASITFESIQGYWHKIENMFREVDEWIKMFDLVRGFDADTPIDEITFDQALRESEEPASGHGNAYVTPGYKRPSDRQMIWNLTISHYCRTKM